MVTAAELLSEAAFEEGHHAQAFPSFGSERTGAPVVAYCRISEDVIRTREPVSRPHALVIQDSTLLHQVDLFSGLREGGYVLVNTRGDLAALGLAELLDTLPTGHAATLAATDLALKHIGRAVPNAALLGGLAALTGVVQLDSVVAAVWAKFPREIAKANIRAATAAYDDLHARPEITTKEQARATTD